MHYYEEVKNMLKILEIARNEGMEQGILQTAKEMLVAALEEKLMSPELSSELIWWSLTLQQIPR
jgi:hypothetical protein